MAIISNNTCNNKTVAMAGAGAVVRQQAAATAAATVAVAVKQIKTHQVVYLQAMWWMRVIF